MKYNIPLLTEVNLQAKEFNFYFEKPFEKDKLTFNVAVDPAKLSENEIGFFIHIEFFYPKEQMENNPIDEEPVSLLQLDYTCEVSFPEEKFETKETKIPASDLSQLLGMSFLMARGALAIRLKGNTLEGITFPIQNPTKILEAKLEKIGEEFVIHS